MEPSQELANLIRRKISLEADLVEWEGETIYFYFDSPESWDAGFQTNPGLKDAIVRAYMLGFRQFIFVRHDGLEFPSTHKYWIPRDRPTGRGRGRFISPKRS